MVEGVQESERHPQHLQDPTDRSARGAFQLQQGSYSLQLLAAAEQVKAERSQHCSKYFGGIFDERLSKNYRLTHRPFAKLFNVSSSHALDEDINLHFLPIFEQNVMN